MYITQENVTRDGRVGTWTLSTTETLTDERASQITFMADPKNVVLGTFVQVIDAEGTRIGHLSKAEYAGGIVIVSIKLM